MSWMDDLLSKLSGQQPAPPPINHAVFGRIWAGQRPKTDAWHWQMLDPIHHPRGEVTATWRAGREGPSQAQIAFWQWLCSHIDEVVEQSRELLAIDVAEWTEKPVPADIWQELTWKSADLPIDGDRNSDWEVSFATPTCPDVLLAVVHEQGRPLYIRVDD